MPEVCLKDCQAWRDVGLTMTTTSNEACKLFDDVITQYITWTESPDGMENTVVKLLESDSNFMMGQALSIGLDMMGTGRALHLDKELAEQINKFESDFNKSEITPREKLHCQSVVYFAKGEYTKACESWEEILKVYPKDSLAIKFAHDSYFYLGDSVKIRDSVDRVLPYWKSSDPLYGYLKGMLAFGLEETYRYEEAQKSSEEALSLNPTDCWATHAKAHCFEMTGRFNQGIEFLKDTENDWAKGRMLACHNYWHWALYHIERGDYETALGIYDHQVEERSKSSGAMLDMVDAASLLQRFEMQGVNVGDRWKEIYELALPHINDHITVFNDFHMTMAFLGCGKTDVASRYMKSLRDYCAHHSSYSRDLFHKMGVDLCDGLIAFSEDRFVAAVQLWYPLKDDVIGMGGSHAQRDVFDQLLLNACIDSPKNEDRDLAQQMLSERKKKRENSPLTDRLMQKLLAKH
ncbi:tetratricopeptide repeat protein 38-like [Clytia hemisphaerica]|uniref:Tetratricopeptide repeat protein 38 n=2 Tax=Clytia hemisphaerica TaxID=252671 RepID=A0A7M5WTV0_9CNID|eukprot:TCONS_00070782-protein